MTTQTLDPVTHSGSHPADATVALFARARSGDRAALNSLFERYLPPLRRWAHGRMPRYARDIFDTQDLVQDTALRMLRHVDSFEVRHSGGLHAYLRKAVHNAIKDQIRRSRSRPDRAEFTDAFVDVAPTPVDLAMSGEVVERYRAALRRLKPTDRAAAIARVEFHRPFAEIAIALGKPTADAARVAVARALVRLVELMDTSAC